MPENIQEKVENKIIDLINTGAGGRLIIFKPEKSDKDLVVEKRGDYKAKPIFLKVFDKDDFPRKEKLAPDGKVYSVFARFDIIKQDIEDEIFIVSSLDNKKISINKNDIGKFLMERLQSEK
jgi:hypothetical protein